MTLSCGEYGGVNVTRCKDECGGSQCENWLASDECTVHLGSCAEITPVPPVDAPAVDEPIAPVGNPLPGSPVSTPTDNLQSAAIYVLPSVAGVAALVALAV